MKNRDIKIDIAKGISIILVEISHLGMGQFSFIIDGFIIPIFFILSGYTYNNSISPNWNVLHKKFRRLIKPYLFYNLVYLIYYFPAHNFKFEGLNQFIGIIYSRFCLYNHGSENNIYFLSLEGNSPSWFLTAMFTAYTFFYFIVKFKNKISISIIILIYLVLTFTLSKLPILLPWSIDNAFLFSLFIFIGLMIKKYNIINKLLDSKYKTLCFIFCICTYLIISYFNKPINLSVRINGNIFLLLITSILGTIFTLILSSTIERGIIGKIFKFIGVHSVAIMCLHLIFYRIINRALYFAGITNLSTVIVTNLLLGTSLSVLFSVLINKFYPKFIK